MELKSKINSPVVIKSKVEDDKVALESKVNWDQVALTTKRNATVQLTSRLITEEFEA